MKIKHAMTFSLMVGAALASANGWAAANVTAKEAEAMVKKGVAFIKANGKERGYAEITSKQSQCKGSPMPATSLRTRQHVRNG